MYNTDNTNRNMPTEAEVKAYLRELLAREKEVDQKSQDILSALVVEVFEGIKNDHGKSGDLS